MLCGGNPAYQPSSLGLFKFQRACESLRESCLNVDADPVGPEGGPGACICNKIPCDAYSLNCIIGPRTEVHKLGHMGQTQLTPCFG